LNGNPKGGKKGKRNQSGLEEKKKTFRGLGDRYVGTVQYILKAQTERGP